jgi:ATP-dependent DNA helicase RecG
LLKKGGKVNRIDEALRQIENGVSAARQLEDDTLDFKRAQRSRNDTADDMADAAVCFANAGGGTIILGVADGETGAEAFLGTDMDAALLRRRIYEVTSPHLDVVVRDRTHLGKHLLEITVQEGLDVYSTHQKMPTRRWMDSCVQMTAAEVSRLHEDRRGGDWSASDAHRAISEIDPEAELVLRSLARRTKDTTLIDLASGSTLRDLLAALGLLTPNETLNRAGELLLCAPTERREVIVYQHRGSAGGEADHGRRWSGPLVLAYTELLSTVEARIGTTPVNLPSGQQVQIEDYPTVAVREAISNAIMHGDHRERRPVYVEHSPQVLQVVSPGPLVAGISPDNILTHPPKPRFPVLAEVMRSLGLAERWGQGVDRMFREMIRTGRDVPVVDVTSNAETSVRFLGSPPNTRVTKFISDLPSTDQDDTDVLLLVSYLTRHKTVTAQKLSVVTQRDVDTAQSVLERVANAESGFIEPTKGTENRRQPTYRFRGSAVATLGPALAYQARPAQTERDKKIVDHVREYDSVNNGTVQRMFDVDVHAASSILQDLVQRELLVRTSEQSRGKAVKYGPGPSFPTRSTPRRSR